MDSVKKLDIWHNIMWSKYKAVVFCEIQKLCENENVILNVIQIAETDEARKILSDVDYRSHDYNLTLLFKGSLSNYSVFQIYKKILIRTINTKADIVILTGYENFYCVIQAIILKGLGKKVGVFCDSTVYDHRQSRFKWIAKFLIFKLFDIVFCYGARSAEYVKMLGVRDSKIVSRCQAATIPEGYEPESIIARRELDLKNPTPKYFLFVGRLSVEKNVALLLWSFEEAFVKDNSISLKIVGSGGEQRNIENTLNTMRCRDAVELLGSKSGTDLFDIYCGALALILPSYSEPWGLVVNEALHCGCPVIVSYNCGCVPELVESFEGGLVVATNSADDLTEALLYSVKRWGGRKDIAEKCLVKIAPYSAISAANNILTGCLRI